jgi:hypothetical protein
MKYSMKFASEAQLERGKVQKLAPANWIIMQLSKTISASLVVGKSQMVDH